jgi:hypothetical protein
MGAPIERDSGADQTLGECTTVVAIVLVLIVRGRAIDPVAERRTAHDRW